VNDLAEIASWYREGDNFNPHVRPNAREDQIVRLLEEAATADGRVATFADALIALQEGDVL
jgi:hypothetical protein